jgi:hypothetical protein
MPIRPSCFYTLVPQAAGGRLYSDTMGRQPPMEQAGRVPPPPQRDATSSEPVQNPPAIAQAQADEGGRDDFRLAEIVAGRLAAFDRERRERDAEALRSAQEEGNAEQRRQKEHEREARTLAGMGYRLTPNQSGISSNRTFLADSMEDCALACSGERCDAFGYWRDQKPPGSREPRYCYLFTKPFVVEGAPGYVLGQKVPDPSGAPGQARNGAASPGAAIQAAPRATANDTATPDGLTRCDDGPVKVTGFKMTCDRILGGGAQLLGQRMIYTLENINDCAAKCRPIRPCVAFAYHAGDPNDHTCLLFGSTPEGRHAKGWIAGER